MFSWIKKKCTRKYSKRLRTSSISDLTRSHDYTSHPDTNIYHEIDEERAGLAYAVTSLVDLIDAEQLLFLAEACPLCRHHRFGKNTTCQCIDIVPSSPYTIQQELADNDDFSWLEYDSKEYSKCSLHRSRSESRSKTNRHAQSYNKQCETSDDSCSSGFYEADDSSDEILANSINRSSSVPKLPRRLPNSPSLAPRMGCTVLKRTQSAVNASRTQSLRKSKSVYLTPLKLLSHPNEDLKTAEDGLGSTCERQLTTKDRQSSDEEDDIFDHLYANVCIDINNLEIPKLRKSSYRSRSHGQNRLLDDLLKMNHDKQIFSTVNT